MFQSSALNGPFVPSLDQMYNPIHSPTSTAMSDLKAMSGINFTGPCDDIHHLILMNILETSPSSLCALAFVSHAFNAIATPYLYRNVVIYEGEPNTAER
jgi:hypothetical protein